MQSAIYQKGLYVTPRFSFNEIVADKRGRIDICSINEPDCVLFGYLSLSCKFETNTKKQSSEFLPPKPWNDHLQPHVLGSSRVL